MVDFGHEGGYHSGQGRVGGRGPGRRARGEGAHLHRQVLGAGHATAAQELIRVSVHHQQPGAVRNLADPVHHLQRGEDLGYTWPVHNIHLA